MAKHLETGDPAPSFQLPTAGGEFFDSSDMAGKHWLLSFQRYAT